MRRLVDLSVRQHPTEHVVGSRLRPLSVTPLPARVGHPRVVSLGRLHHPGEESALKQIELGNVLVEEEARSDGEATTVTVYVELVGVELEDLLLAVVRL